MANNEDPAAQRAGKGRQNLEHEEDVDVDAEERLQAATLGLKRQADELLLAEQHDKALRLYRELLMHLTRSQVKLMVERDLVVSCRMNILAALSKLEQWTQVVSEATATLEMMNELQEEEERKKHGSMDPEQSAHILARTYYFRGFARFRLGAFATADVDFREALALSPEDEGIREDYEELQVAVQTECRVKQHLSASIKQFQAHKYKVAVETCTMALREAQPLQKDELTGLIHGNLAAIFVKTKDDTLAVEHYKRALLFATKSAGTTPSPAQHERIFDLLDALAGCYSRKKDYSSAMSVINDQIRRFPNCPGRSDREAMMYLNGGRVCCTMGNYEEAEKHLLNGKIAAGRTRQSDLELNCAYWLSRAFEKTGKSGEAISELDSAIPAAEKEQPENVDLIEKLMLARLEWLHPAGRAADKPRAMTPMRIAQLWRSYEFFEQKRSVHGQLCAAEALVEVFRPRTESSERVGEARGSNEDADLLRALRVVDTASIGKLPLADASILIRLVFIKVDLLVEHEQRHEAKALLARTLRSLQLPGRNEVTRRHQFRVTALNRLLEIVLSEEEEDKDDGVDEDINEYLQEAIELLRQEKDADANAAAMLSELLRRIARFKAAKGELEQAEEMLNECADLPDGQQIQTLLPLCIVQLKQGHLGAAAQSLAVLETLPGASRLPEVSVIQDKLNAARAADASRAKRLERHAKSSPATRHTHTVSITGYWWVSLVACVAAVVAALFVFWV